MLCLVAVSTIYAGNFSKQATLEPLLVQSGKHKHWCGVCGMNLKMFYKTSHTYEDANSKKQYCSIRCLLVDTKNESLNIDNIRVVDVKSEKLISAKDAFYVVSSKVKGTMSRVSKLAFASKSDALEFAKKYKGKVVDFNEAMNMAKESLESDINMVSKKKKKKMYPMGEKIYKKKCQEIDSTEFSQINMLKAKIKTEKLCKPLNEKQLQALSLYLFEVKRVGDLGASSEVIKVSKDEKCPICGMFVYKYPKWAAQIFYKESHLSFDGVKDLMKYYFEKDSKKIEKILVTDYYSQKAIDAKKAYYVVGSDIYGPMGDELIPFENESDAKTFSMDHKGIKILKFKDITSEEVYNLDE